MNHRVYSVKTNDVAYVRLPKPTHEDAWRISERLLSRSGVMGGSEAKHWNGVSCALQSTVRCCSWDAATIPVHSVVWFFIVAYSLSSLLDDPSIVHRNYHCPAF